MEDVKVYTINERIPIRSTTDVEYTYSDSARIKNVLKAGRVDQFQQADSTYSEISEGFELTFFTREGEFDGRLTARNGYLYDGNAQMIARDSVVFVNKIGEMLNTEELYWNQDSATVSTNKFVTITRKDGVISGKGLLSNQNFSKYEIRQPTGFIYMNETKSESATEGE